MTDLELEAQQRLLLTGMNPGGVDRERDVDPPKSQKANGSGFSTGVAYHRPTDQR